MELLPAATCCFVQPEGLHCTFPVDFLSLGFGIRTDGVDAALQVTDCVWRSLMAEPEEGVVATWVTGVEEEEAVASGMEGSEEGDLDQTGGQQQRYLNGPGTREVLTALWSRACQPLLAGKI